MELVSKNDLIKNRAIMWDEVLGFKECVLMDDIMNLPVTELIRCKECEHWSDCVSGCTEHVKCCKIGYYMVGENGYCVYGERRSDV